MIEPPKDQKTIKSLEKAFNILEYLKKSGGASMNEVANEFNVANSTAYLHLRTMMKRGYITEQDGNYRVGVKFLDLGSFARQNYDFQNLISDKVRDLSEETGELTEFSVMENGKLFIIQQEFGNNAVRINSRIGKELHMHRTAAGKVILAKIPESMVDQIIDYHGLPKATENTTTDRAELFEELKSIRKKGLAENNEESIDGLWAMAMPVKMPGKKFYGAMSISGPIHRLRTESHKKELYQTLHGAVNELEINMEHSIN
ncbi:IclR family transcriptional regulator [Natronorubrum tibetense]|nr:IclR family transcriptional regulator [Natronorubrum tibetense]